MPVVSTCITYQVYRYIDAADNRVREHYVRRLSLFGLYLAQQAQKSLFSVFGAQKQGILERKPNIDRFGAYFSGTGPIFPAGSNKSALCYDPSVISPIIEM